MNQISPLGKPFPICTLAWLAGESLVTLNDHHHINSVSQLPQTTLKNISLTVV
jgi:hypothetical protein